MFFSTLTSICPLLCEQKGLKQPQASGCVGAAHTELPTEPGTKIQRIWGKGCPGVCPWAAKEPLLTAPGSPCTPHGSNLCCTKLRGAGIMQVIEARNNKHPKFQGERAQRGHPELRALCQALGAHLWDSLAPKRTQAQPLPLMALQHSPRGVAGAQLVTHRRSG